jgi:hypothetical protein
MPNKKGRYSMELLFVAHFSKSLPKRISENQVIRFPDYIGVLPNLEHEIEDPSESSPQGPNGRSEGRPKAGGFDAAGSRKTAPKTPELRKRL